ALTKIYDQTGFSDKVQMEHSPLLSWIVAGSREQPITVRMISNLLFEGNVICVFPSLSLIMSIKCAQIPVRTPEESSSEISIRGAKDGLVEDLGTNIALIRKRVRNEDLIVEPYMVGTLTDTKVALLYIKSIANEE